MRIRIVMSSICYIMMGHPGFLLWETVEELMEYINDLIFHRLDGADPDVQFFNRAYLLTMNHWSNELRVADVQLEALCTCAYWLGPLLDQLPPFLRRPQLFHEFKRWSL